MTPAWPVELTLAEISRLQKLEAVARRWAAVRRAARPQTDYRTPHVGPYATSAQLHDAEQALLDALNERGT